eukprot:1145349-Pelagomonas_calceolata.AAC.5
MHARTGHYELNLTTPVHQAIAVRLKDVAYGEPSEGSNWYNVVYDMYSHAVKVSCSKARLPTGNAQTYTGLLLVNMVETVAQQGC